MSNRELSLAVVGIAHPNADGSNRQFEVAMCTPGEVVYLEREPRNKADPNAVLVRSARGIQIGYLTADRAAWLAGKMDQGEEIRAIFQQGSATGAVVRANLSGNEPTLPVLTPRPAREMTPVEDVDFWPDFIPPDD